MYQSDEAKKINEDYIDRAKSIYEHFKKQDTLFLQRHQSSLRPKNFFKNLFFFLSSSDNSLEYYTISKILKERASEEKKRLD